MSKSFADQKVVVIVISSIMSRTTALEWSQSCPLSQPIRRSRVEARAVDAPPYPTNGPTRAELLAAVAGGPTQNLA